MQSCQVHDTLLMVHAFQFDDTTAFAVPHFGNRESKRLLQKYRLHFVPWMVEDVARESNTISTPSRPRRRKPRAQARTLTDCFNFYSLFSTLAHWICRCTLMYTLLRSIKTDKAPVRQARKLFLLGDNFSEVRCCVLSTSCC